MPPSSGWRGGTSVSDQSRLGASRSSAQLLMQKRWPPASGGPSSKRWPRWPPHLAHTTSVRRMKCERSSRSSTASATAGSVKLGQPEPESNLVSELNSSAPQPAQVYMPLAFSCTYLPANGGSVACLRSTAYWSGASSSRHWSSVFSIFSMSLSSPVCGSTLRLRPERALPSPAFYTHTEGQHWPTGRATSSSPAASFPHLERASPPPP